MKTFCIWLTLLIVLSNKANSQTNLYIFFQEAVHTKFNNWSVYRGGKKYIENAFTMHGHKIWCKAILEFETINKDSTIIVPLSELWKKYPIQTMDKLAVVLKSMELPKPPPAAPPKSGEIIKFSPSKGEPYFDEGCIRQSNYMASFKNIYIVEIDQAKQVGILTRVRISNKFE